jgi:hypothetical protein
MALAIVLTTVLVTSAAYLLHQYRSGTLYRDETARAADTDISAADADTPRMKAA